MRLAWALVGAALLPAADGPAQAASVTELVFDRHLLAGLTEPANLRYRYELSGIGFPEPYRSSVLMEIREVHPDGQKVVDFDMFEGDNRRQLGPVPAQDQNPLVLVFLQRDITQMGNLTGGSPDYFRRRLREAFNGPAQSEAIQVTVDGRELPATRIVMRPFEADPSIDRFPQYREKAYEFVVGEGVPGGVFRIATTTPGPKPGDPTVLQESITFDRLTPRGKD